MGSEKRLQVRQAHTYETDEGRAVAELREQLQPDGASGTLLFCSSRYDLARLGREIAGAFATPIAACTTAGQLGLTGYQTGGITGVCLKSTELRMQPFLISPLTECQARAADAAFLAMSTLDEHGRGKAFGLVLVDGLSLSEERLAASLYQSLGNIPLVGGSAGDDRAFKATHVYHQGEFLSGAASLVLFETTLPFTTFKVQHAQATRRKLVVTLADPEHRIVREINGEPAAEAYAEMLGVELSELDSLLFSRNPLMLQSGGDYYVRSVQRVHEDHSLSFFCGLEEGLVMTLGTSSDPLAALEQGFAGVEQRIGVPDVVIGCDCILRRLEFARDGREAAVGDFLASRHVVGFNTYGEQFNSTYVNQTFSAVALSSR